MYYKAQQGDTWDKIAKIVYDNEFKAQILMESNFELLDILVFAGGEKVLCPFEDVSYDKSNLPDWRK